jgi:hypothetical protein
VLLVTSDVCRFLEPELNVGRKDKPVLTAVSSIPGSICIISAGSRRFRAEFFSECLEWPVMRCALHHSHIASGSQNLQ